MSIGTRSVLFGAHCFFIHPWFVAWAWWTLFGFPWDPRLWVAFFVHDLGYWGKPNLDGSEGELHPELGGTIMHELFGVEWAVWTECHSRFYARNCGIEPSALCLADKLAFVLTPAWLYLPLANATGEIHEYMAHADRGADGKYRYEGISTEGQREWHRTVKDFLTGWVAQEQRDGDYIPKPR